MPAAKNPKPPPAVTRAASKPPLAPAIGAATMGIFTPREGNHVYDFGTRAAATCLIVG